MGPKVCVLIRFQCTAHESTPAQQRLGNESMRRFRRVCTLPATHARPRGVPEGALVLWGVCLDGLKCVEQSTHYPSRLEIPFLATSHVISTFISVMVCSCYMARSPRFSKPNQRHQETEGPSEGAEEGSGGGTVTRTGGGEGARITGV